MNSTFNALPVAFPLPASLLMKLHILKAALRVDTSCLLLFLLTELFTELFLHVNFSAQKTLLFVSHMERNQRPNIPQ